MVEIVIEQNSPLAPLSTLNIGGKARYLMTVTTCDEMQQALAFCRKENLRYLILGKGSNCLFDSLGFNGAIICNKISFLEIPQEGVFVAGAGYSFSLLGVQSARKGFSGLEFASGIPGTVGGAIYMNAGANGQETCTTLSKIDYLTHEGELLNFERKELTFSYRKSPFQNMKGAIISATFRLKPNREARKKQIKIISYRKETQPYGKASAGCIFRNPEKGHAGALIEQCNLKGVNIGGARISTKHANFIINDHNASSKDVLALIELIKTTVKAKTNIELQCEARYIPHEETDHVHI